MVPNDEQTIKQTKICASINPYSVYEISSVYNVFVVRRASRSIEAFAVFSATGVTCETVCAVFTYTLHVYSEVLLMPTCSDLKCLRAWP